MGRLVDTFFGGSVEGAVSNLLGNANRKLSNEELERISTMIDEAKQRTRKGKKVES